MSGKKFVTLLTLVSFVWLIQLAALPLKASPAAGGGSEIINSSDSTGIYEVTGNAPSIEKKKKSILPMVLIGVGVAAVAAVLVLVVFKTKYDITGAWELVFQWSGEPQHTDTLTFTGTRESGSFITASPGYLGTYKVDGKNAEWVYTQYGLGDTYTGKFTDKDTMSGTMKTGTGTMTGTWSAKRK
jgi:hypothetical protein